MIINGPKEQIKNLLKDLRNKIEQSVPEVGEFPMVYSEFRNSDKELCLTDVLLTFRPVPNHLPDHETQRWLEVTAGSLQIHNDYFQRYNGGNSQVFIPTGSCGKNYKRHSTIGL